MNLKSLFATALAVITLASCTKEVIKEVPTEPVGGPTKVKIALSPDNGTRASDHYSLKPSKDEYLIYNYALFIFNSSGLLEESLIATISNGSTAPKSYLTDFPGGLTFTQADNPGKINDDGTITLTAGNKTFFAVVNAPAHLLAVQNRYVNNNSLIRATAQTEELEFNDLKSIVGAFNSTEYTEHNSSTPEIGIVKLTNVPNATASSSETPIYGSNRGFMMTPPDGLIERYLPETEEGQSHEINIGVGRAMAKVSLASALEPGNPSTQPNGDLNVWSYKIVNNPKAMYIMTNWSSNSFITPYFSDLTVDTDKYFDSEIEIDDATALANGLTQDDLNELDPNYMPASVDGRKTFTYAIENANLTPKQGNSTAAIVKGKFEPISDNLYDADGNQHASLDPDGTFWRIWIPEYDDGPNKAGNAYDARYFVEDPTSKLIDLFPSGSPALAAIQVNESENIRKYDKGICYYGVWLNNDQTPDQPWGVKRNKYYMINIISVSGAGEPDEGGVITPEVPLDEQADIKVKIDVLDWEGVPQGGAL